MSPMVPWLPEACPQDDVELDRARLEKEEFQTARLTRYPSFQKGTPEEELEQINKELSEQDRNQALDLLLKVAILGGFAFSSLWAMFLFPGNLIGFLIVEFLLLTFCIMLWARIKGR